jgi:hypothetical protein
MYSGITNFTLINFEHGVQDTSHDHGSKQISLFYCTVPTKPYFSVLTVITMELNRTIT